MGEADYWTAKTLMEKTVTEKTVTEKTVTGYVFPFFCHKDSAAFSALTAEWTGLVQPTDPQGVTRCASRSPRESPGRVPLYRGTQIGTEASPHAAESCGNQMCERRATRFVATRLARA